MGRIPLVAIGIAVVVFASIGGAQTDPSRADLEARQTEIRRELESLIGRIDEMTPRGTEIEERQEYVERILALRQELERLSADLAAAQQWVLRLTGVELAGSCAGSQIGDQIQASCDHRPPQTGYTRRYQSSPGSERISSMRFLSVPEQITIGEPFTFKAELKERKSYPDEHYCFDPRRKGESKGGPTLKMGAMIDSSFGKREDTLTITANGRYDLISYCSRPPPLYLEDQYLLEQKGATDKDGSVTVTVRFEPGQQVTAEMARSCPYFSSHCPPEGSTLYRMVIESDGEVDAHYRASGPGNVDRSLPPSEPGNPFTWLSGQPRLMVFAGLALSQLVLIYEPVETATAVADYEHPEDLLRPPREGSSNTLAAEQEPVGPEDAPELAPIPAPVPAPVPAPQPRNERLRTSTVFAAPETAADVLPGSPDANAPTALRVADVVGSPAQSAKAALESDGFAVDIEVGAPARSRIDAFRVASQIPAAGAEAKPGERIRLTIHGDWVAPTAGVPDLYGLPAAKAKSILENRGFTADISVGTAARSAADEFTVASQVPSPTTDLDRGETVRVTIHGRYEAPKPTIDTTRSGGSRDRSRGSSTESRLPGEGPVSWTPGALHRGSIIKDFLSGTPQECRQACSADERCVGFNWADFTPPAGTTGAFARKLPTRCQFMGTVTGKYECRNPGLGCVSGLKEGTGSATGSGESTSEPEVPGLEGVWQSTWGPIDFSVRPDGTVRGRYGRRNGRIIGRFDGRVLEGVWVKDLHDRCSTQQDGSGYWGRVRFELDSQTGTFAGVYGYCDEPMTAAWKFYQ